MYYCCYCQGALEEVLERKDMEIKKLTEKLELTLWEHEAESSIYLEVVGERACEWTQLIENLGGDFNRKQVRRFWNLLAAPKPSATVVTRNCCWNGV